MSVAPTYLWRGRACTVMYRSHGEALIRMADSLAIRIVPLAELTRPVGDACPHCGTGGAWAYPDSEDYGAWACRICGWRGYPELRLFRMVRPGTQLH